jgi:beta-galactosidase
MWIDPILATRSFVNTDATSQAMTRRSYSNRAAAPSLNGECIEETPVDPFLMADWQVPHASGRLEPVKLRLAPDRGTLACDGCDAVLVAIEALDEHGRLVLTANFAVAFEFHGPGRIFGVGSGDPNSHEPEKKNQCNLFNGLAQIIVQATKDIGEIKLTATADGLSSATTVVRTAPTQSIHVVP